MGMGEGRQAIRTLLGTYTTSVAVVVNQTDPHLRAFSPPPFFPLIEKSCGLEGRGVWWRVWRAG